MSELPTLRFQNGSKVAPGDRIGTVRQVFPGVGTYAKGGHIYASTLGRMEISTATSISSSSNDGDGFTVSVVPRKPLAWSQVLQPGQLVLCRVTRVSAPQCTVDILAIEGVGALQNNNNKNNTPAEGSIAREECVKSGTATREVQDCFQPGDIVLAKVLSLGDTRRYFLTTAEPELGVLYAVCYSSGKPMIPYSWKEMQCPDTHVKEARKCAKPRRIAVGATGNEGDEDEDEMKL